MQWWEAIRLVPLVAGILALQLLLYSRVMFPPEARHVLRDLHRPLAGGEDMHQYGDAPHRDAGCGLHPVKLLDAQGDVRRITRLKDHLRRATVRQGEAPRGVLIEKSLLGTAQPALHDGFGRLILEVLAADGAVADLLDQVTSVLLADRRESEFRAPLAEEIQPENPLVEGLVPVLDCGELS